VSDRQTAGWLREKKKNKTVHTHFVMKKLSKIKLTQLSEAELGTRREMNLLNSEEMNMMHGGYTCSGSGDTVMCAPIVGKIVMCATAEANCQPSSQFSSDCTMKGVTISCPTFTVGK